MSYRHGNQTWATKYDYLMECIQKARETRALCMAKLGVLDELIESLHAEVRKELTKKESA